MCVCCIFICMKDLREEVQFLKEQLKRRECEWWQAHSELQSRVDSLSKENQELMKSQRVVHVRPQRSSGRSTPHPDTRNPVSFFTGFFTDDETHDKDLRHGSVIEFGTGSVFSHIKEEINR